MPSDACVFLHAFRIASRHRAVSRESWPGPQFSVPLLGLLPGFLNIAPDNKEGLRGMAVAHDQLLGYQTEG